MFDKIPQVFISYSWTSKEYQQLIVDLASRMRHDGVDVKLDVWDLKEGQDKYAYMEQCVTNPEIDKVLILSDRIYSEKADARKGGVGDETTIISAEVYGNADQHKFIPVVMERDEEGKEYLPTYLKSRMYRDLSGGNYEEEYEALLRTIFEQPSHRKPEIGERPSWLTEETPDGLYPLKVAVKRISAADLRRMKDVAARDFVDVYIESLKQFYVKNIDKDAYLANFAAMKEYRDDKYAFMEQSIEKADKVLVLCDKKYTEKANAREGGVGTETAIITPNVYENHEQEKFIPVIMEDFKCVPTYLKSRLGIDFRDGHRDQGFEELLHTIYNKPLHVKPPLGKPPAWLNVSEAGNETNEMRGKELIEKVILESIGDRRFTSADIAKLTGRTQASVHRILSDMLDKGLIIRAGGGYLIRKQDDIVRIKVCIKVWQEIIDPTTGKNHDEKGLNALDAIMYGPVHEVDEITSDLEKKLLDEFKEIHPNFRFDCYEIQTDEEC